MAVSGKKAGIIVVVIIIVLGILNYWYYKNQQDKKIRKLKGLADIYNHNNNRSQEIQGFANVRENAVLNSPLVSNYTQNKDANTSSVTNPTSTDNTFYYFYNPNCQACKNFKSIFDNFLEKIKQGNISGLTIIVVDVTDNQNDKITGYYNIRRTPTLILATPSRIMEYDGQRTPESIYNFVANNVSSNNTD